MNETTDRRPLHGTALKRFVRELDRPNVELAFVLHDVEDPVNVGSAFRIADASRVDRMLLTGITPQPPHRLIAKTGRHKDRRVRWEHDADASEALARLRDDGFERIALELTEDASPYDAISYPERVALVVGNEDHGIPRRILSCCDRVVFLPMYGKGASLNVAVSLGIVAYHVLHVRGH
ncbi:RNA methyltransferase [Candidatus Poribacteria bacterium]|nr:RNA methyltransferase [Candidatus Poribacteria bacterium]